jgi:hypothetical protein
MSASTRTAPAQLGLGGLPTAIIAMALVVIIAAAVAFAALNGTKVAPATGTGAQNVPLVDHGSRGELSIPVPAYIWHDGDDYAPAGPVSGPESFGGWNGPRLVEGTRNGGNNGLRIAQ